MLALQDLRGPEGLQFTPRRSRMTSTTFHRRQNHSYPRHHFVRHHDLLQPDGWRRHFVRRPEPNPVDPSMAKLAPYQWLYILLMITATVVAIWGIFVTISLARGKRHAYRNALIVLALSALAAGVQTYASIVLRGKGAPQNMRFYITFFTWSSFDPAPAAHLEVDRRFQAGGRRGHNRRPGSLCGRPGGAHHTALGHADPHRTRWRQLGQRAAAAIVGRRQSAGIRRRGAGMDGKSPGTCADRGRGPTCTPVRRRVGADIFIG